VFLGGGRASIEVGANGLTALVGYPAAAPIASLLQTLAEPSQNPVPGIPGALPELTDLSEART
jgi:mannose-6-phosphate isomerase